MNLSSLVCHLRTVALSVLVVAVAAGCGKKQAPPDAAAAPPDTAAPAPAAPAAAGQASPSTLNPVQVKAALAEADAAVKAREYDKAAQMLLAIQRQKQLTEQQAEAARQQMIQFQRALAGAVASGDPNAKAAAELLRRNHQ